MSSWKSQQAGEVWALAAGVGWWNTRAWMSRCQQLEECCLGPGTAQTDCWRPYPGDTHVCCMGDVYVHVCVSGLQSWPSEKEKQDWSICVVSVYVVACKALLSVCVVTCVTIVGTHLCVSVCNKTGKFGHLCCWVDLQTWNCSGCITSLRTGHQI